MSIFYQVGSTKLNLKNTHDIDYVGIVDSEEDFYSKHVKYDNKDIIYRSIGNITKYLNFKERVTSQSCEAYLCNIGFDENIVDKSFPIKWSILDHREDYIKLLNEMVDRKLWWFHKIFENIDNKDYTLPKDLYRLEYLIYILENNTTELTKEELYILQKLHDKQMPVDFIEEIIARIKKLK